MRRLFSAHSFLFALLTLALPIVWTQWVQAQTFTVLHAFSGGGDGSSPVAGVTMDRAGNLYGTTLTGGIHGSFGIVFKMSHKGSGWVLTPVYSFAGRSSGQNPYSGVILGANGTLYGTTSEGGGGECNGGGGCGNVFSLRIPASTCKTTLCSWNETVLYAFAGGGDGGIPLSGPLVLDHTGSVYGTASLGGDYGKGVVYKLTPSGGTWTETVLYSFTGGADGQTPNGGVTFDNAGNLYGTAVGGTYGCGTVYQLTPSESGWTEGALHEFNPNGDDGCTPTAALIIDQLGNLYGTTQAGGASNAGTVFEMTPSDGDWAESVLYSFSGTPGGGPVSSLSVDIAGNLFGTTLEGGVYGLGSVFRLTPSGGGWIYTDLHDFTNGGDGGYAYGNVILDNSGNLYGTAFEGGNGAGVVWEIAP